MSSRILVSSTQGHLCRIQEECESMLTEEDIEYGLSFAKSAMKNAYSLRKDPILVGAALIADNGCIYMGCNVSNDCTNIGFCSERVALGNAVVNGEREFKGVVIITNQKSIWPPCGACRQAMYQFCKDNPRDFEIISFAVNGKDHKIWSLDELLPDPFNLQGMDADKIR